MRSPYPDYFEKQLTPCSTRKVHSAN